METGKKQNKKDLKILMFGFFLIISIVAGFGWKSYNRSSQRKELEAKKKEWENSQLLEYASISAQNLSSKIIFESAGLKIIDLREKIDFESEHIKNARNYPWESLEKELEFWNKEDEYILVDSEGLTALEIKVLEKMKKLGFGNFSYLEGGFKAWSVGSFPTIRLGDPRSLADQAKVNYINSEELKKILDSGQKIFIVDVRSADEFKTGKINGAASVPLGEIEKQKDIFPSDQKIILYDEKGLAAFQAAVKLFDLGVLNVYALSEGINIWKQKGFEVVY